MTAYTPDALVSIVRRRLWAIVLPGLIVTAGASWWVHALPDRYRSDVLLLAIPQRLPETFVRSTVPARTDARLQSVVQQILSRTQLESIIRSFDLYVDRRAAATMQDVVDSMRRDIEIQPVKGDAFRLGFTADNPAKAMRVADRLAALFIGQTSSDRSLLADGAEHFLETQLEEARAKLVENEAQVGDYRRRHNGELPAQLEANVQGLHSAEMQLQMQAEALNRDRERQLGLERSLNEASLAEASAAGATSRAATDVVKATAADQLEHARRTLDEMQSTFTAQHPDVVALKQTIAELARRADAERDRPSNPAEFDAAAGFRRSRVQALRAELAAVEVQIAQKNADVERLRHDLALYQQRIDAEPAREAELAALTRDYDTVQQAYRGLLTKKQESEIAANLERQQVDAQFKVLDPARLPERPSSPDRARLYSLGSLAGLGAGLLVAVILEWFDRSLRTGGDVSAALSLPVLATIPFVRAPGHGMRAAVVMSVGTAALAGAAAIAWFLRS
jgi:polysaccharide chain length determinant protein (PEP-CTERM system associated)